MYVIGIDFSIRYPAACISRDFTEFDFVSVINDPALSGIAGDFVNEVALESEGVDVEMIERPAADSGAYHAVERAKLVHHTGLVDRFVRMIRSRIGDSPGEEKIIAMEGLAYGAKGNSLVDISMATGMLRSLLLGDVLKWDSSRFFVFSPSEIKRALGGKGNCDKVEIFERFLDDPVCEAARGCGLSEFLTENRNHRHVFNGKEVRSPWNDMLDAYLCVLQVYNNM